MRSAGPAACRGVKGGGARAAHRLGAGQTHLGAPRASLQRRRRRRACYAAMSVSVQHPRAAAAEAAARGHDSARRRTAAKTSAPSPPPPPAAPPPPAPPPPPPPQPDRAPDAAAAPPASTPRPRSLPGWLHTLHCGAPARAGVGAAARPRHARTDVRCSWPSGPPPSPPAAPRTRAGRMPRQDAALCCQTAQDSVSARACAGCIAAGAYVRACVQVRSRVHKQLHQLQRAQRRRVVQGPPPQLR